MLLQRAPTRGAGYKINIGGVIYFCIHTSREEADRKRRADNRRRGERVKDEIYSEIANLQSSFAICNHKSQIINL